MALSFFSGWNSFQHIKPELSFLQAEPEPPEELLDLHLIFDDKDASDLDQLLRPSNEFSHPENSKDVLQYLKQSNEFSHSENCEDVLQYLEQSNGFSHPENCEDVLQYLNPSLEDLVTTSPYTFPTECSNSWHCPKREKIDENHFFSYLDSSPASMNDCLLDYYPPLQESLMSQLVPSLPQFPFPPSFTFGHAETVQKSDAGLSQQSIGARQRRRKIAEKLQELGKLVPGGTKMNTAEMLRSAFKYVKFMQAQIGIVELMRSSQEAENPINSHELQCLLSSPVIQEKLYSREKCLVPKEFVSKLENDDVIDCKPSVVKEIEYGMPAHELSS